MRQIGFLAAITAVAGSLAWAFGDVAIDWVRANPELVITGTVRTIGLVLLSLISLAISWGGTDAYSDWHSEHYAKPVSKWHKRTAAFALAFVPFLSTGLIGGFWRWYPGGGLGLFWSSVALALSALGLWPWIRGTIIARISNEIIRRPIIKRDAKGNIGVKPSEEDPTVWHDRTGNRLDQVPPATSDDQAGDGDAGDAPAPGAGDPPRAP